MDMNFRTKNPSGSLQVERYTLSAVIKADLDRYGDQQQYCQGDHQAEGGAEQAADNAEIHSLAARPHLLPSPDWQQEHRERRPDKDVGGIFQNGRKIVSTPVDRRLEDRNARSTSLRPMK
ncbi:hypothetical protein GR253_28235 [Rhizobium leguminosarum]|nr:hypothetical protein [Rhizobium leguminosarum]